MGRPSPSSIWAYTNWCSVSRSQPVSLSWAGRSHISFFEEGPHPNPPHKGEGTLPRTSLIHVIALNLGNSAKFQCRPGLPPPCGEGLRVGYS
ncbi:hypothetical protein GA829_32080 [Mesorhizobium sp. INR15]|nr:hypothetical protein GA829_32080 [Mesorhizobium sp. INR15]